jgi:hypothetical protein
MAITSKTTVREFLDEFNISDKYPINTSRGGAYHGLWLRLSNRLSVSLKAKLKQTEKLKKVTNTKKAYVWEFLEFQLEDGKKYMDRTLLEMAKDLDRTGSPQEYFNILDNNTREISVENEIETLVAMFKMVYGPFDMVITKETKIADLYDLFVEKNFISREGGWWQTIHGLDNFYDVIIGGSSTLHKFSLYCLIYKYEKLDGLTMEGFANEVIKAKNKVNKIKK